MGERDGVAEKKGEQANLSNSGSDASSQRFLQEVQDYLRLGRQKDSGEVKADASREIPLVTKSEKQGERDYKISFMSDGRERSFQIHLPKHVDSNTPIMLILHGANAGKADGVMSKMTGMNNLADKNDFIAIYPLSLDPTRKGMNSWNADNTLAGQINPTYDDTNYIKHLLNVTALQFGLDKKHVAVVGFSDGAAFANHLVSKMDGQFEFIATVCGTILEGEPVARKPPEKALFIQSGSDPYMLPYRGGEGLITKFNNQKGLQGVPELPNLSLSQPAQQPFQYAESASWSPVLSVGSRGTQEYVNVGKRTTVEVVNIPGSQHGWPGSTEGWPVIGESYKHFNASERIVRSWLGIKLPTTIKLK